MEQKKSRAVIMGGADISDYSFYMPLSDDFVICADRGYLHARNLGVVPDVLLGDFDSLDLEKPDLVKTLQYPAEKDATDLQIALEYAGDKGFREIYVIGALGGRTDHFLANVCMMRYALEKGCNMILEDNDTKLQLLTNELSLSRRKNFYLSVIPIFESAVVSLSGVKYPISEKRLIVGDTLGVSNEFAGGEAHIRVHSGSVLVLECRADKEL